MKDRLLPLKQPVLHPFDPPLPLHVYVVRSIDHHLGHPRIPQQELDGTEPDDLVGNLVDHSCKIPLREQRAALAHQGQRLLANAEPSLRARRRAEPAGVDAFPELRPQLTSHLGERIRTHATDARMARPPWSTWFPPNTRGEARTDTRG